MPDTPRTSPRFLAAAMLLVGVTVAAGAAPAAIPGPYMAQALSFYFVHPGGPLKLTLQATAAGGNTLANCPKILYRFFTPDEALVKWDYQRLAADSTTQWSCDFGAVAPAGVYQVRYAGQGLTVDAWATPACPFGLAPSRSRLSSAVAGQFGSLWLWVPPATESFSASATGMSGRVVTGAGDIVAEFAHGQPATVDTGELADDLLHVAVDNTRTGAYYCFGFSGIDPVVLSPSPETARAIAAHFKRAADGTLFKHHSQARMQAWIDALTPADLEVQPANWDDHEAAWLAHPDEAAGLLGGWGAFSHLDFILRDQDVDPDSPTFGRFRTRAAPATLALAYALDRPYNPYYKQPGIRNRMLLSAFLDLLKMCDNDTWEASDSGYSGGDALGTPARFLPLHLAAPALAEDDVRALWLAGVRRIADRFPFFRVSCDNQSSHWPLVYWTLYEATRDETFKRLAADYIAGMALPDNDPHMVTGYQQEACGPDATYQGLGAANQALYYRLSHDPNARQGLQRIYRLFNHTVAPEPDGTVFGASGFAHRTRGSWVNRQYGGGLTYMAGELPEAAVWIDNGPPPLTPDEIRRGLHLPDHVITGSPQVLGYATHVIGPYWRNFRFPTEPLANGVLPARETTDFCRNFNDEFLAVRRQRYYFMAYLDGRAPDWLKSHRRTRPDDLPHPNNKWNCLPGPQLFWTPEYGSLYTAMNWGADTLYMVRADLADGTCSFPDYWAGRSTVAAEKNGWRLVQPMIDLPLTVDRRVAFEANAIVQKITLTADADVTAAALYEQIPLLHNKPGFALRFRDRGQWRETPGPADAFWVGNEAGDGVLVALDRTLDIAVAERQEFGSQAVLPLRIMLPSTIPAGKSFAVSMAMGPFRQERLAPQ